MTAILFAYLFLMAVIAALSFFCGWRAAYAFLEAAQAVSSVTNSTVTLANEAAANREQYIAALDKQSAESASLRAATEAQSAAIAEHRKAIEDGLRELFHGFERTGIVRSARPSAPARQVGEAPNPQ